MFTNVLSFLRAQIICGLCLKHNGLLQAKLAADKVTHTYALTHMHTYQAQSTVFPSTGRKERGIKEGGKGVHSS